MAVTQEQMEQAFEYIEVVDSLKRHSKERGDLIKYREYLNEFYGILTILYNLGLLAEWDRWRAERTALTSR